MIKHVVLFKLKKTETIAEKQQIMEQFKQAIEALTTEIDAIIDVKVTFNCNPQEEYDMFLDSTFATMDDLNYYSTHPLHVAAGGIIKDYKESRACIDFEI